MLSATTAFARRAAGRKLDQAAAGLRPWNEGQLPRVVAIDTQAQSARKAVRPFIAVSGSLGPLLWANDPMGRPWL